MLFLRLIYLANVFVAGSIAYSCLRGPERAAASVFQHAYAPSPAMTLVGCLWLAIAVLSLLGLWRPVTFAPVLLLQFIYKGVWLAAVAYPAFRADAAYPRGMASFFVVWVLVLPWAIPWRLWWSGGLE